MVWIDVLLAGLRGLLWNIGRKTNRAGAHIRTLFRSKYARLFRTTPVSKSTYTSFGDLAFTVCFRVSVGTLCFYLDVSTVMKEMKKAYRVLVVLPRKLLGFHPSPILTTQDYQPSEDVMSERQPICC